MHIVKILLYLLQSLPSELFCDHISVMAEALQQAARLVFHKEMEVSNVCVCVNHVCLAVL